MSCEEEKKNETEGERGIVVVEDKKNNGSSDDGKYDQVEEEKDDNDYDDDHDDDDYELQELPKEIQDAIGENCTFSSDKDLTEALEKAGFGDLRVVLWEGKPWLVMPSDQHNSFTTSYVSDFLKWSKFKWGVCSATHKIHLTNSRSRDPDLSYWGYPRCTQDQDCCRPADRGSIPDVIIQFGWKNPKRYEEGAIDDMMNQGLENEKGVKAMTRPALGYLIKVRFSKKRKLEVVIPDATTGATETKASNTQDMIGLDIYRLTPGTTMANGAQVSHYRKGGPEVWIVITAQDLGITGFWAMVCGDYKIKASRVFDAMDQYHNERRARGLAK